VLVALDKTKRLFHLQLVWLGVLTPVMVAGVLWNDGIGAGVAQVVVALLIVTPIYLVVLVRTCGLPLAALVKPAGYPLIAAVVAGTAAHLAAAEVDSPLAQLGVGLIVLLIVYVLILGRWLLRLKRELTGLYGRQPEAAPEEPGIPVLSASGASDKREEELL
jgi:hypothetical protein